MKRNHLIGFTVTVMVGALLVSALPVRAQSITPKTTTDPGTTEAANQEKLRADRVAKRKADFKTKLTNTQQKRVQTRCKNAQTLLNVNIGKAIKIQTNRDKIHTNLLEKLTKLEAKLESSDVDTTKLKTQIADLKTKINTFKTDTATYIQAAQDAAAVDCQADPVGFKASLEASRAAIKTLQADAVAIRTTFAQEIKPRLAAAKTALETKQAE